jgi:hypothetical protein
MYTTFRLVIDSEWGNGLFSEALKKYLVAGEQVFAEGPADVADFAKFYTETQDNPPAPFHWREREIDDRRLPRSRTR